MHEKTNLITSKLNGETFSYLSYSDTILQKTIRGRIINSIDSSKNSLEWKRKIAKLIYDSRRGANFSSDCNYAISLSMRFLPSLHGNHKLDVENFTKPILDGIAAGLFCPIKQDPLQITRFNYDDSNFNTLFIEKFEEQVTSDDSVIITISQQQV